MRRRIVGLGRCRWRRRRSSQCAVSIPLLLPTSTGSCALSQPQLRGLETCQCPRRFRTPSTSVFVEGAKSSSDVSMTTAAVEISFA
jgi:hypothetical protein